MPGPSADAPIESIIARFYRYLKSIIYISITDDSMQQKWTREPSLQRGDATEFSEK
jgi:hypothetical protein